MDLGLSEQQELLRRTARDFLESQCPVSLVRELEASLEGYSPALWKHMADLGWLGLAIPSEYGGEGAELLDQAVLFEELGRALVPGPLLVSSALAVQAILQAGDSTQKSLLLPGMARGDIVVTTPLGEPGAEARIHAGQTHAAKEGSGHVLNGTIMFVPYAHVANYLLCVADTPGPGSGTLFLVDTSNPGIRLSLLESVAGYKQYEVGLQRVKVASDGVMGQVGDAVAALAGAQEWATVVQCAEIVGRSEKVLEMVVDYSQNRVQFGRPIGSFQAVQHQCADLKVAVDGARLATYQAGWTIDQGLPCADEVAIAKAYAGSLSRRAAATGHGIFAGIAFTVEHDMQLYMMRSKIAEANLGDTDFHLDRLQAGMGL